MSEEATQQPAANTPPAPAAPPAPPASPPAPTPPAAPAPAPAQQPLKLESPPAKPEPEPKAGDDQQPAWLPDRLKQARGAERNALLKELGAESPDDIKAKLTRLQELEDATLSEQERVAKQLADAQAAAARGAAFEKPFTNYVQSRFEALTPEQQALIDSRANGDPLLRHEGIQYLDALAAHAPAAPPVTPPKPASTPEAPKPPPASGGAPKTKYEEWRAMAENPATSLKATFFYRANKHAIEASRPT